MDLHGKKTLIILGGMWHDFEGFAAAHRPLLEAAGCQVEATYDLDMLTRLPELGVDVVISYTSLSKHREGQNDTGPEQLTDAQVNGLAGWVCAGGSLLAAHSATVVGSSNPDLGRLMGGVFESHPPQFAFTVVPLYGEHPITAGVEAFTVHDEFYIQRLVTPVDIHMAAFDRGYAYPMVWSKTEGLGRVVHLAMGHSALVWDLPLYQRLFMQSMQWLINK